MIQKSIHEKSESLVFLLFHQPVAKILTSITIDSGSEKKNPQEHPKLLVYCIPKNFGYELEINTGFFF